MVERFQKWERITWAVDTLNTHRSLEVCQVMAKLNRLKFEPLKLHNGEQRRVFLTDPNHHYRFVCTPTHGSWLNQVELSSAYWVDGYSSEGIFDRRKNSIG